MKAANLSVWNNNWSEVYDFTPKTRGKNWSLLPEKVDYFIPTFEEVEDDIMRAQTGSMSLSQIQVEFEPSPVDNVIPVTFGNVEKEYGVSVFVVFKGGPVENQLIHGLFFGDGFQNLIKDWK